VIRRPERGSLIVALSVVFLACGTDEPGPAPETATPVAEPPPTSSVIEVTATNYAFTAPPKFPSGWVTLRFDNQAPETHFMILWRLPEGKSFDEWVVEVANPFNSLYREYRSGALSQEELLERLGTALPDWFWAAQPMGGPGFTAPDRISQTTVFLEPGDYVMECYVRAKDEADTFHSKHGMLRPLIVTEETAGESPPEADLEITLSNYEISVQGEMSAGEHRVRVRVEEDPEGFVKHNVHLARLDGDTSAEDVAVWLDWVDAMLPPAPAVFLGGAGQRLAGSESYLTVTLEPGRYAWVSEAWGVQGMTHEFVVD
jgi:hypothetical protein